MDSSFFRMNLTCIGFWRTIIDNLMTHDKTTFRDLMSKYNWGSENLEQKLGLGTLLQMKTMISML